jgi:hypothetical protein
MVAGAALMLGVATAHATFIVDDFETSGIALLRTTVGTSTQQENVGGVGNWRYASLVMSTAGTDTRLNIDQGIEAGRFEARGSSATGYTNVYYGANMPTGPFALNANLGESGVNDRFQIDWWASDISTTASLGVVDGDGTVGTWSGPTPAGLSDKLYTQNIAFSAFSITAPGFGAGINWADIDGITFLLNLPNNGDYLVNRIITTGTVPEPSSLALLGLFGLAGGLMRRRRS